MEIRYKGSSRIFLCALIGVIMVCSSYLIYFYNPLKYIISKATKLSDGSIVYRIWEKPTYEIFLRVFVFNITNGEAFISGKEKLRFEEVGPYVFQETLHNSESIFHDNGTLTYVPKRSVRFIPEMSIGDPMKDVVFVPNVPLLGIASMLHQSSMFLNLAVLSITRVLNSQPILNLTVHDYFWGYEDKLVNMASTVLPNWIDFPQFGILDRMFDEGNNSVTITVDPDKKGQGSPLIDERERGRLYSILTWNGSPGLSQWGYKKPVGNETIETNTKCNMLEGAYDGTIYFPNMEENERIRLYRKFFCRTVPIVFDHSGQTSDGFDGYWFKLDETFLDTEEENPDNACYCKDKNYCLPKGLGDATPCYYGFPTAVSQPHFLNVEPWVLEKVDGLSPDTEKHGTSVVINPDLGFPLEGHSRMQINLVVRQTRYNSRTAPFNNMVLPLFWSEMRVDNLPQDVRMLLTLVFKVLPITQTVLMFIFGILGASLIASAGILVFLTTGVIERQGSISLGYSGYSPIRMIPIRRESCIISESRLSDK